MILPQLVQFIPFRLLPSHPVCAFVRCCIALQEEARTDLHAAAAALQKERQALSVSTSDADALSAAAATAAKPRSNTAVIDSDSDVETVAPAGMHLT